MAAVWSEASGVNGSVHHVVLVLRQHKHLQLHLEWQMWSSWWKIIRVFITAPGPSLLKHQNPFYSAEKSVNESGGFFFFCSSSVGFESTWSDHESSSLHVQRVLVPTRDLGYSMSRHVWTMPWALLDWKPELRCQNTEVTQQMKSTAAQLPTAVWGWTGDILLSS